MNRNANQGGRGPDRREFLTMGVGLLFVATVPILSRRGGTDLVRRTLPLMGTTGEIVVDHPDRRYAQQAIDAALKELSWVESTMSRFREDSDIGRANTFASTRNVSVSAATATVLAEARRWAEQTSGRFDPCLGRVSALWRVNERTTPAAEASYRRFQGAQLYREMELSQTDDGGVLRFTSNDVGLDLGGIAKGYGVDRAVEVLRSWGIQDALVSVGGDLYAMGSRPGGDPWRVGVRSADDPDVVAVTLEASDQAIATSGDYERYFVYQGRRYHHILDPATAEPFQGTRRSLTVGAPRCMSADAAATALFGSDDREAQALLLSTESGAEILHSIA
jgi:FAD:protein FMN transferase